VGGVLEASSADLLLNSTFLSFGTLPGGQASLASELVLSKSTFYALGNLSSVTNILFSLSFFMICFFFLPNIFTSFSVSLF
jgi:hypothetical protein